MNKRRMWELIAFLMIMLSVFLGVLLVDAFADQLEQRAERVGNTDQMEQAAADELSWISEQLDEEPAPYEDPQESEKIEAALDWHYIEDCELTAYCSCSACCGEWALDRPDGIVYTASGAEAQANHTIAVDPDVIPLGAWVEIDGDPNLYHAEDVGGSVNGNHIDVYFDGHDAAWDFGHRYASVRWYV